jgi:hypothetical protein
MIRPATAGVTKSIEFSPDGQRIYGSITFGAGFGFLRLSVGDQGTSVLDVNESFYSDYDLQMDNGVLYSAVGRTIDPKIPVVLSEFGPNGTIAPDARARRVFQIPLSVTTQELRVYEVGAFQLLGTLPLPGVRPYARHLTRCGSGRLAFRTDADQLFVLRSPLADAFVALNADLAV